MVKLFYGRSWRRLQNLKNKKIKEFIDVIIIITIYNSLFFNIFVNENFEFSFKYLNIKPVTKRV